MRKPVKKYVRIVRDFAGYLILKTVLLWRGRINHRGAVRFGRWVGALGFYLARKHRKKAIKNLRMAFGDTKSMAECNQIARKAIQYFVTGAMECIVIHSYTVEERLRILHLEGGEHLKEALAQKKGVIGLTAHFGDFALIPERLILEGHKCSIVVKSMKDKKVESVIQQLREEHGFNTIYLRPPTQCARSCLQALRDNHVLVLLGDQRFRKGGVIVNFFGRPAATAPGAASLALSTGAPVLPMFMVPRADDTQTLVIEKTVPLITSGDKKADIKANMQRFTDIIESYVRRYPQVWSWNHSRWKIPPATA